MEQKRIAVHDRPAARRRVEELFATTWTIGDLIAFHTREKLLLLAHDEARYRILGPLVANGASMDRSALAAEYRTDFEMALATDPTKGNHVNALHHAAGWLRGSVPIAERVEATTSIDRFIETDDLLPAIRTLHRIATAHEVDLLIRSTYLDI